MKYGLTFNNKHSYNDYELFMQSLDRSSLPEPKIITEDDETSDGEHDFSEANPDGEIKYRSRTFEVEFYIKENNLRILRLKARNIAAWLACGEKQLIFDDQPDVYYMAKVINKLDIEKQIFSVRRFTVQFKCRPFAFQLQDTQNIDMDSDIMVESDLRLDDEFTFEITGNTVVEVNNFGTRSVKPVIQIVGSFTTLSIAIDDKTFYYNEAVSNGTVIVENHKKQVTKDGINKSNKTSGDFLKLPVGINEVQISGTGLECQIYFVFRPLYY